MVTPEQITEIANQLKSYQLKSIVPKFVTGEEFCRWLQHNEEADNKHFDDSQCDLMVDFLKGRNRAEEYMLFINRSSCSLLTFKIDDSFYHEHEARGANIIAELVYDSLENKSVVANSIQLTVRDLTDDYRTAKHYLDVAISYEELKLLSKELYN